jgi:TRAP-type mannitol/chloroaromatic compound transport system permease small subunit
MSLARRALALFGGVLAGAALLVVLGTFAAVLLRYGLAQSWAWLAEAVLLANAAVFLLGAGYTLYHDQHVRVDVYSRHWSRRRRAQIELGGMLVFLLPFCLFVLWVSADYVLQSYRLQERSREAGGLARLWPFKALIPAFALVLLLAAVARARGVWRALRAPDDVGAAGDPSPTADSER